MFFGLINTAHADSFSSYSQAELVALDFVASINEFILFPLIALLSAVAFIVFLWGAFEYVRNADSDQGRQVGSAHMLWGVIGLMVMLSAYAILSIAAGTFGLRDQLDKSSGENLSPLAPGETVRPEPRPGGSTGGQDGRDGAGQNLRDGSGQDLR